MNAPLLLACPMCAFSHPLFWVESMVVGTVVVTHLLLRSHKRGIRVWGIARIRPARLVSLMLMLVWLVPLWFTGRRENSISHVSLCLGGLATCCLYLWFRFCWLLDTHQVRSAVRELVFPGLLTPVVLVFGTTVGSWLLVTFMMALIFPAILVPYTIFSAVIALPSGFIAFRGVKYTFAKADAISPSDPAEVDTPLALTGAEPGDQREPA